MPTPLRMPRGLCLNCGCFPVPCTQLYGTCRLHVVLSVRSVTVAHRVPRTPTAKAEVCVCVCVCVRVFFLCFLVHWCMFLRVCACAYGHVVGVVWLHFRCILLGRCVHWRSLPPLAACLLIFFCLFRLARCFWPPPHRPPFVAMDRVCSATFVP